MTFPEMSSKSPMLANQCENMVININPVHFHVWIINSEKQQT
uniref:Uncharacterized protein n=1 Tax=Rhizophora mucronata TaxID=61149 RepID=A0A2P2IQY8_RHIMU